MPEVELNQRIYETLFPGSTTRINRPRASQRTSARQRVTAEHVASARQALAERLELITSAYPHETYYTYGTSPLDRDRVLDEPRLRSRQTRAKSFEPQWTHPLLPPPGFSHNIVQPAIDLEGVLAGQHDAVAPLPNTTPLCAGCQRALRLDGAGDTRIWALPCGHVIDGHCMAVFRRRSGAAGSAAVSTPASPTGKSGATKTFVCPVAECSQRCHPEPGHRHSCIEVYI